MQRLNMTLEKTTAEHFADIHAQWYSKPIKISKGHAEIINPWVETDYERVLEKFLCFNGSDQIRVHNGEKWMKWYRRKIGTADFYDICQTIEMEGKGLVLFELVFKTLTQYQMITEVKFTQIEDMVIGYHTQFPKRDAKLFEWNVGPRPRFDRPFVYALWNRDNLPQIRQWYSKSWQQTNNEY
ncbi:hypothetical protein H8D36_00620 [archaeon]|nr:hypothetical protein [archaeon]MBL7057097.1 hypothetical protein [Candidatus Woesearchaeota archaeon]